MSPASRSQRKREALALQKMGERLVVLNEGDLAGLALPEELKAAVAEAQRFKSHEARRRQLQYIGRLMRQIDPTVIEHALQQIDDQEAFQRRRFKTIEGWRDELINGNDDRWQWLRDNFPDLDAHRLEALIRSARGLDTRRHPKRAARELFRFLNRLGGDDV